MTRPAVWQFFGPSIKKVVLAAETWSMRSSWLVGMKHKISMITWEVTKGLCVELLDMTGSTFDSPSYEAMTVALDEDS